MNSYLPLFGELLLRLTRNEGNPLNIQINPKRNNSRLDLVWNLSFYFNAILYLKIFK